MDPAYSNYTHEVSEVMALLTGRGALGGALFEGLSRLSGARAVLVGAACGDVDVSALTRAVEEQRVKAALAPMLTMQVAAVPVSFGALALLLVRLGGLGGVGACAALHGVTGGRLLGLIPRPEQADALLKAMAGKVGVVELLNSRDFLLKTLDAFTSPALWRPVLSFSMFALLVTYALLLELSLLYWRSGGGPEEEGADEEEGGEKKRKGGAAAKAATAAVEEEEEEDEDLPSALISKKEK
jgi:hypothetical protein